MKSLQINQQALHLKVIKNDSNLHKNIEVKRIFINTLTPNFTYTNSHGEIKSPINQVLL
jgi:hypothetical protein